MLTFLVHFLVFAWNLHLTVWLQTLSFNKASVCLILFLNYQILNHVTCLQIKIKLATYKEHFGCSCCCLLEHLGHLLSVNKKIFYHKIPNFSESRQPCCKHFKAETMRFHYGVMPPKDANYRIANREDCLLLYEHIYLVLLK